MNQCLDDIALSLGALLLGLLMLASLAANFLSLKALFNKFRLGFSPREPQTEKSETHHAPFPIIPFLLSFAALIGAVALLVYLITRIT